MLHDLSSEFFGKWAVLSDSYINDKGNKMWLCRCLCGTEKYVLQYNLLSKASTSCGCSRYKGTGNLVGKKFGKWLVIDGPIKKNNVAGNYWKCKCECGNTMLQATQTLRSGLSTQCRSCANRKTANNCSGENHYRWNSDRDEVIRNKKMVFFMHRCLKRLLKQTKSKNAGRLLGYTKEDLISHLESMFEDGMSWDNYGYGNGKWNIDHIVPISYFLKNDITDDPGIINALSNLRPMWHEENLRKGYKVENG